MNDLVVEGEGKQRKVISHLPCCLKIDVLGFELLMMKIIGLNRYKSMRRPVDK